MSGPERSGGAAHQQDQRGRTAPERSGGGTSAVWRAARAAARRRRLQTVVIGVVVLVATATLVLALGLVAAAAAGPFDHAFAVQRGAHVAATFADGTPADQLAQAAHRPGVEATAGPFGQAVLRISPDSQHVGNPRLTVVGRADPAGPVDHLNLWRGRWAPARARSSWPRSRATPG